MEKALLEIYTASALSILKLVINALIYNYVFQEFSGCLKGIKIKVLLVLQSGKHLMASTINTLHNTINGYEIAYIWNAKYNVYVCMIQTNADFIFQKLIVFVSCYLEIAKI